MGIGEWGVGEAFLVNFLKFGQKQFFGVKWSKVLGSLPRKGGSEVEAMRGGQRGRNQVGVRGEG